MSPPRMDRNTLKGLAPDVEAALVRLSTAVAQSGLEPAVLELVKLRASQINGCAFCLQMHATAARTKGVSEEKLQLLPAWREAPVYTDRERAALAMCEAVTRIDKAAVSDALFEATKKHFSEKEVVYLVATVVGINAWNRIAITFRFTPEVSETAKVS